MSVQYNDFFNRVANSVRIEVMETGLANLGKDWRSEDMCSPYSRLYYVISGRGYLRTREGDRAKDETGNRINDEAGDEIGNRINDEASDEAGEEIREGRTEGNGGRDGKAGKNAAEEVAVEESREGEIHILRPGYVYLIPNGLSYDYFCEDRLEKAYFHINVLLQDRLELFYGCRDYYELPVGAAAVKQMKQWIVSDRPEDFFHIQGEIYHAVAAFMKMAEVEEKVERNYSEMVARLFGLLPQLKVSVPVREMARSLNVSESTLAKRFRKETGMSIGAYRQQLAMSRARQLLALGKLSVGEIAEELGYCDQFYFCRYFKERQGMTPSAYRQRYAGTYLR